MSTMQPNHHFHWPEIDDDVYLYAQSKGLAINAGSTGCSVIPITLFPTELPRTQFCIARRLHIPFQETLDNVARDLAFLDKCLSPMSTEDTLLGRLYCMHKALERKGSSGRNKSLGIFRSDYYFDSAMHLKLEEFRTFNVTHIGLAPGVTDLHRYTLHRYRCMPGELLDQVLPQNNTLDDVAQAIVDAKLCYEHFDTSVLIVVRDEITHIMDQKKVEWALLTKWNYLNIYRRTFKQLKDKIELGPNNELLLSVKDENQVTSRIEISVVYYRTGSKMSDYADQNDWNTRFKIEESRAIKCSGVHHQLAGLKPVYSLLRESDILERFVPLEVSPSIRRQMLKALDFPTGGWHFHKNIIINADGASEPIRHETKVKLSMLGTMLVSAEDVRMTSCNAGHLLQSHVIDASGLRALDSPYLPLKLSP